VEDRTAHAVAVQVDPVVPDDLAGPVVEVRGALAALDVRAVAAVARVAAVAGAAEAAVEREPSPCAARHR
jgi:hypothetical protein